MLEASNSVRTETMCTSAHSFMSLAQCLVPGSCLTYMFLGCMSRWMEEWIST